MTAPSGGGVVLREDGAVIEICAHSRLRGTSRHSLSVRAKFL
jgi:hypothetical protein